MRPDSEDELFLPEPLADVHRRLLRDGGRWQASLPDIDNLLRVARQLDATPATPVTGDVMDIDPSPIYPVTSHQHAPRKGPRRILPIAAAVLLVALSVAVFSIARSHQHNNNAASGTPTATPHKPGAIAPMPQNLHMPVLAGGVITAISMVTANDGWVAGYVPPTGDASGQNNGASNIRSFFVHFHDGTWTLAPDTSPVGDMVGSLVMTSQDDGWAVGVTNTETSDPGKTLVWHFTGGHWQLTTIPALPENSSPKNSYYTLDAVYAPTPDFVWISAFRHDPTDPLLASHQVFLTYHAGAWSMISVPGNSEGSLVSPTEGWALQQVSASSVHFLHYQQGNWTDVTQVSGGIPIGQSIKMLSAQEGWAMVQSIDSSVPSSFTYYHFSGNTWQKVTLPGQQGRQGTYFNPTAPDQVWLADAPGTSSTELVTHGQEQVLPLPQPYNLTGQITVDGDGGAWAVASHLYYIQGKPVPYAILYDLHGVWTIYGIAG